MSFAWECSFGWDLTVSLKTVTLAEDRKFSMVLFPWRYVYLWPVSWAILNNFEGVFLFLQRRGVRHECLLGEGEVDMFYLLIVFTEKRFLLELGILWVSSGLVLFRLVFFSLQFSILSLEFSEFDYISLNKIFQRFPVINFSPIFPLTRFCSSSGSHSSKKIFSKREN